MNEASRRIGRFPHRTYPCNECPFRLDNTNNPQSQFPAHRWDELSATVRDPDTAEHPQLGDPMFGCHKGEPGTNADVACAGWLALYGHDHVAIRLALARGELEETALQPSEHWPQLHRTWDDVLHHQTRDE